MFDIPTTCADETPIGPKQGKQRAQTSLGNAEPVEEARLDSNYGWVAFFIFGFLFLLCFVLVKKRKESCYEFSFSVWLSGKALGHEKELLDDQKE